MNKIGSSYKQLCGSKCVFLARSLYIKAFLCNSSSTFSRGGANVCLRGAHAPYEILFEKKFQWEDSKLDHIVPEDFSCYHCAIVLFGR